MKTTINLDQLVSSARIEANIPIPAGRIGSNGPNPSVARQRLDSLKVGESFGITAVNDTEAAEIRKRLVARASGVRKASGKRYATRVIRGSHARPEVRIWRTV